MYQFDIWARLCLGYADGVPCTFAQNSKLGLWLPGLMCSDPTSHLSWYKLSLGHSAESSRWPDSCEPSVTSLDLAALCPVAVGMGLAPCGTQAFSH